MSRTLRQAFLRLKQEAPVHVFPRREGLRLAALALLCTSPTSTFSTTCPMSLSVKVVPHERLHVSEPDPRMFGNGPNEKGNDSWSNKNWLKSMFHFSFAEYSNPSNSNFGVLRVMNDDLVQPRRGFGTHPHHNMEIVTYVVAGSLTHQDSIGTKESLGRGSIQFMTAGTGVRHSEFNDGDKPLRFIQTWIVPTQRGLKPNYGSYVGCSSSLKKNQLRHLVSNTVSSSSNIKHESDTSPVTPVHINQDVDAYAAELELGQKVVLELPEGRQAYLLCIEGGVKVNGKELGRHDACEITISGGSTGGGVLDVEAYATEATEHGDVAHFLMFAMKAVPGSSGRGDL